MNCVNNHKLRTRTSFTDSKLEKTINELLPIKIINFVFTGLFTGLDSKTFSIIHNHSTSPRLQIQSHSEILFGDNLPYLTDRSR